MSIVTVREGIDEQDLTAAAELYWQAFGVKLDKVIGPREHGVPLIERNLDRSRGIAALEDDHLVGLAGFHLDGRSLANISGRAIAKEFGWFRSLSRMLRGAALGHEPAADELLMDGIVVKADHRGRGVGSMLMDELFEVARREGKRVVRLEVLTTNPSARHLYEQKGFVPTATEKVPFLRRRMGFPSATTMERVV